jgi:hypothetical protein
MGAYLKHEDGATPTRAEDEMQHDAHIERWDAVYRACRRALEGA